MLPSNVGKKITLFPSIVSFSTVSLEWETLFSIYAREIHPDVFTRAILAFCLWQELKHCSSTLYWNVSPFIQMIAKENLLPSSFRLGSASLYASLSPLNHPVITVQTFHGWPLWIYFHLHCVPLLCVCVGGVSFCLSCLWNEAICVHCTCLLTLHVQTQPYQEMTRDNHCTQESGGAYKKLVPHNLCHPISQFRPRVLCDFCGCVIAVIWEARRWYDWCFWGCGFHCREGRLILRLKSCVYSIMHYKVTSSWYICC